MMMIVDYDDDLLLVSGLQNYRKNQASFFASSDIFFFLVIRFTMFSFESLLNTCIKSIKTFSRYFKTKIS